MDTHRIGEPMGGRGGGIVVVFDKEDKHRNVCEWICKRLRWSKVDTESPLSLALLKKETEKFVYSIWCIHVQITSLSLVLVIDFCV